MPEKNIHATALLLGDRGVLISGPSGAGKTTLALTLIGQCSATGCFARLVGDDRLFVEARGERLVASCPEGIAGLAEVYGLGPRPIAHRHSAVVDLVVRLVAEGEAPRLDEPQIETIAGIALPRLDLSARRTVASALAVKAWLKAPPFR